MINLLKDMATQLEKEGEEDQEVFEKVSIDAALESQNVVFLNFGGIFNVHFEIQAYM